jgi:hypothetical protein
VRPFWTHGSTALPVRPPVGSRIDLQIAAAGKIRLVACAFDGAATAEPIGLVESRLQLLLDRQGDRQGQGHDGLQQQTSDRAIETAAWNGSADRFGSGDAATLTGIRGPENPVAAGLGAAADTSQLPIVELDPDR